MSRTILERCADKGRRMTGLRRTNAAVPGGRSDHPDVDALFARVSQSDAPFPLATGYRTVKLFGRKDILEELILGDGRARCGAASRGHHDHLIDLETTTAIGFVDPEIDALQDRIGEKPGYRRTGHRPELYGVSLKDED